MNCSFQNTLYNRSNYMNSIRSFPYMSTDRGNKYNEKFDKYLWIDSANSGNSKS